MNRFNISLMAERLTAYAIERQNSAERHQHPGFPSWMEQRRLWTDAILQGMTRLEGRDPAPELMDWYDQRLEAAHGHAAVEPLPANEQAALIRDLSRYTAALEATGDDRRRQIAVVADLLEDMVTHLSWDYHKSGLARAAEQTESTLQRMTARMPIRFTRILLGGERGPCESDFVSGAVTGADAVKATALYERMCSQYPEVAEWPATCTVCVGRGLDSALGTTDASDFDLDIIRNTGDRFLKLPGVRGVGTHELEIPADELIRVLKIEPGTAPEIVTMPNMLDAFQAAVGGYIETVGLDANVALVCNEKGKLIGLPANRQVGGDIIAGTFLIVGAEYGEFCSLSDADAAHYAEQFAQPMPACSEPEKPTQWEFYVL